MAKLGVLLFVIVAFLCAARPAMADKRVAVVIGNGAYQHADPLANPLLDARAMRDMLAKIGFDVLYGEDLAKRDLERLIGRFASATENADVAISYYAGHGATFNGTPYLVPVDAQFRTLNEMPYELVPVEAMVGELRRVRGIRIAILDACRDNAAEQELKRNATRGGSPSRGLERISNSEGLVVAYATQYNATAADGPRGANSPFTSALLKALPTPGVDVKELFFNVGAQVVRDTGGKQRPEISVSIFDRYTLVDGPAPATAPVAPPSPSTSMPSTPMPSTPIATAPAASVPVAAARAPEPDQIAWDAVERSVDQAVLRAFVSRYPASVHRPQAEARIAMLAAEAARAARTAEQAVATSRAPPEQPVERGGCVVADPTGTPLNLRESPNGAIIGAQRNGGVVDILRSTTLDGKPWAFVRVRGSDKAGWAFRRYLRC